MTGWRVPLATRETTTTKNSEKEEKANNFYDDEHKLSSFIFPHRAFSRAMFVALKKKKLSWSIEDKKLSVGNDDFEGARTNGGRRRGRREVFVRCFFHKMHRRLCYFPLFFARPLHPSYVLVR